MAGLTRKQTFKLVDALRKSFLYQTPRPVFDKPEDDEPSQVLVRMPYSLYCEMMGLIQEAGGWVIPPEARKQLLLDHEVKARRAHGDGVNYDFSDLTYGELIAMVKETERVAELAGFHAALLEEMKQRAVEAREESSPQ